MTASCHDSVCAMSAATFRFLKKEHLRTSAEFQRVYQTRCSASDGRLIVYGRPNDLGHARLGLSVSRKVGGAVVRNRLRRLYREAFRLTRADLPADLDLVVLPRSSAEPTLAQVQESLRKLSANVAKRLSRRETP